MKEYRTNRLLLRRWRDTDLEPFARMNVDAAVMQHMPELLDRVASDALAKRLDMAIAEQGFGMWAIEALGGPPFIGFVGIETVGFNAQLYGCYRNRLAFSTFIVGSRLCDGSCARGVQNRF